MFIKYLCYTLLLYVRRGKRLSEKKNMRIVVFSDSHGNFTAVERIFKQNQDADLFIFLGDGAREIDTISAVYPQKQILCVKGNCDIISRAPKELLYTAPDGRNIFACHGNTYSVNTTKTRLFYKGRELGASVVLFGHTHCRFLSYDEQMYMLNPGSAGQPRDGLAPSYAFIDLLEGGGIFCSHVELK